MTRPSLVVLVLQDSGGQKLTVAVCPVQVLEEREHMKKERDMRMKKKDYLMKELERLRKQQGKGQVVYLGTKTHLKHLVLFYERVF